MALRLGRSAEKLRRSIDSLTHQDDFLESPSSSATTPPSTPSSLQSSASSIGAFPSSASAAATSAAAHVSSTGGAVGFSQLTADARARRRTSSAMHRPLKPISSFTAASRASRSPPADGVRFVSEDDSVPSPKTPAGHAKPVRVISSIQGTVLPENNGGLPKMGHTAVCYESAIYVFGGINGKGQYSNHVFCHEKRNLAWREVRGVGVVPRGRTNHAAVLVDSKIYVFGGHRQLEVFDDLFAFDIETSRWERIAYEQTQGPGGVFLHTMVHIPSSDSLFVLGGVHHREQNSFLGHLFDIRNRVWSGVPPPPGVDPQHLQLVTAAYHEPSNSVVVLGLVEGSALLSDSGFFTPFVYLFQPQSFGWRRVETPKAPESPLPFRLEAVWDHFLHTIITSGGGLYDPVQQDWIFPFPLAATTAASSATASLTVGRDGAVVAAPPPPPPQKLGFLVLSLRAMSWSLVLCKFPRKLLTEVKAYNDAERQRMERGIARGSTVASLSSTGTGQRKSVSPRRLSGESAVLNFSGISRASVASTSTGGVFGSRASRPNQSISSAGVTWGASAFDGPRSSVAESTRYVTPNPQTGSDRYRRLVNLQDVPEFTRKFVQVAIRDPPLRNGKLRPMHYFVLHGGLAEATDYAMLAFTPKLTRTDALAATKQNGLLAGFVRIASYRNLRSTRGTTANGEADSDDDDDVGGNASYTSAVEGDGLSEFFSGSGNNNRSNEASAQSYLSMADDDSYAFPGTGRGALGTSAMHGLNASAESQRSFMLPTLPGVHNSGAGPRFAMQFTPQNAVHAEGLLPYPNIPVAVMRTPQEVQKWSKNYYADQRRWMAERMKDALMEDRRVRRLRRTATARNGRPVSAAGSAGGRPGRDSLGSEEDSGGDTDSLIESLYLLESMANPGRAARGGEKKGSTMQALEEQLAVETAAAVVERKEAPRRRVQDFFEERHLEPFVARDVAQVTQRQSNEQSASLSEDTKPASKKSKAKATPDSAAKPKRRKSATTSKGGKKKTSLPRAPKTARTPADILPKPLATVVTQCSAASAGFERLQMNPKRQAARARRRTSGPHGAADGGHDDVARNTAHLLLHNALNRCRVANAPAETRARRAALRWRYLRTLVCTGEAARLVFMASQTQSKMKGVNVSGARGLVVAPELHMLGPTQAYKVPSRPVPYNVAPSTGVAAAVQGHSAASTARSTQVTASGMVMYGFLL